MRRDPARHEAAPISFLMIRSKRGSHSPYRPFGIDHGNRAAFATGGVAFVSDPLPALQLNSLRRRSEVPRAGRFPVAALRVRLSQQRKRDAALLEADVAHFALYSVKQRDLHYLAFLDDVCLQGTLDVSIACDMLVMRRRP